MIDISELELRLKKAENRAEKAKIAFDSATREASRLATALSVIREMSGNVAPSTTSSGQLTNKQQIVVNSAKYGQENAMSPINIYQLASLNDGFDGDVNYVRTTLWRMAERGAIGSANGKYWRWPESDESTKADVVLPPSNEWGGSSDEQEDNDSFGSWDDDSEVPF
jgi:hypothetical protein